MTNTTDKTLNRDEFLNMALQLADSYLKLYLSYYDGEITSIDSRENRSHMWRPVADTADLPSMEGATLQDLATRVMAVMSYQHDWAQVMLRIAGRAAPVILTWHNSEWNEGDTLP